VGFKEQFAGMSDDQLYEVLIKKEYIPEAMRCAEEEFAKRGLNRQVLEDVIDVYEEEKQRALQEPLEGYLKFMCFMFQFQLSMAQACKDNGEIRKYDDCWRWMLYGWIFYTVIFLHIIVIKIFV